MDNAKKHILVSIAMSSIADDFIKTKGRDSELHDLPEYAKEIGKAGIMDCIKRGNRTLPNVESMITEYEHFWSDLHEALEHNKILASIRPPRRVT